MSVQDDPIIEASETRGLKKSSKLPNNWFPRTIQETIDYSEIVQRLYLRHIVTETREMAELALSSILRPSSNAAITADTADTFGIVAQQLSACSDTRQNGGTIGWIELSATNYHNQDDGDDDHTQIREGLSRKLIQNLFQLQPKAGDMHIMYDDENDRYHVVLVAEIWINRSKLLEKEQMQSPVHPAVVGSFQGINKILPKAKPIQENGRILPLETYTIQTSGCQMNVADSERMAGVLEHELGLRAVNNDDNPPQHADLVILNTCSIRDKAEQKLYNLLETKILAGKPKHPQSKKQNGSGKSPVVIVTGCVAQQEGEQLLRRIPEIDAVLGPQYVPYLGNVLEKIALGQQVVFTAPTILEDDDFLHPPVRGHSVRAWVNVITGCNEHCTYCVVPATRGLEQSKPPEAILAEILHLANHQNYKEVTLLGQNIDAYGRDMVPKRTFADLLLYLAAHVPDDVRIRYVTSHPRYFSDRVIDVVADPNNSVCECFHMPFQAGDDEVLRRMRRGYTYDSYMKIIRKIRAKAPDAAICADVIVGFPGEAEEAFEKTLQLMEEVKFDNINSFAYSPRPNTEASLFEDQIDDDVKSERLQRVQALASRHGLERSQRYLGRTVEVLVEDPNPKNPQRQVMGRTRQGRQVYFDGDLSQLKGEYVHVKITEARTWSLMGERVHPERKLQCRKINFQKF